MTTAGRGDTDPPRRIRGTPGLLVAATAAGTGGLAATTVAGASFGPGLLWTVLAGAVVGLVVGEGVGRWHVASGTTLLDGWRHLGWWAAASVGVYAVLWGLLSAPALAAAVGLPLSALVGGLSARGWGSLAVVAALVVVGVGRYRVVERVVGVLVAVTVASVAAVLVVAGPGIDVLLPGLAPRMPPGATLYVLGLAGGVGPAVAVVAYGYWLDARGPSPRPDLSAMRWDVAAGRVVAGVVLGAVLLLGTTALLGAGLTDSGASLVALADRLGELHGSWARTVVLVAVLAATTAALLALWHGVSLLVADGVRVVGSPRRWRAGAFDARAAETSWPFRIHLLWLAGCALLYPPGDRPFAVTFVHGVLTAGAWAFLSLTLLVLLNSRCTPPGGRSGWWSNTALTLASVLFLVLLVADVRTRLS